MNKFSELISSFRFDLYLWSSIGAVVALFVCYICVRINARINKNIKKSKQVLASVFDILNVIILAAVAFSVPQSIKYIVLCLNPPIVS